MKFLLAILIATPVAFAVETATDSFLLTALASLIITSVIFQATGTDRQDRS